MKMRLEATEMWFIKSMLKFSWMVKISNERILTTIADNQKKENDVVWICDEKRQHSKAIANRKSEKSQRETEGDLPG